MNTRWIYLAATVAVIPLGLATRSAAIPWPRFVVDHGGDALYALMIYLGIRALRPTLPKTGSLAAAIGFCFAIEFFQLYQAPWFDPIRRSLFGRLVLGSGFLWIDLVRYTAGALTGYAVDRAFVQRSAASKVS